MIRFLPLLLLPAAALAGAPPKATPALIKQGKAAYAKTCLTCHGEKGDGRGPAGVLLTPPPRNFTMGTWLKETKVEELFEMMTKGVPGTQMAPFESLPEKERWAIAHYIKTLKK